VPNRPLFPIRVFYDGACSVCAREIGHYLRQEHAGKLIAVDISTPDFDPEPYRISREAFIYELHAIDLNGRVYRGVDAFRAIWLAFPSSKLYRALAFIISRPVINPVARLLYKGFARMRPYLPKRSNCDNGVCKIGRKG